MSATKEAAKSEARKDGCGLLLAWLAAAVGSRDSSFARRDDDSLLPAVSRDSSFEGCVGRDGCGCFACCLLAAIVVRSSGNFGLWRNKLASG